MLRRLSPEQPDSFEFTPANLEWARAQMTKYPEGRQQSAIIPVLWRAQEQEGWLSRPAIEYCAEFLGMPYIRVLEVATFYFMFQLQPVGSVANIQICGTTTCMICGAEDLIEVCKRRIAATPHTVSADGKFSWEEVECLGACSNAPMAQIGKDFYEDLTPARLEALIDAFSAGEVPLPGPQNGRFASEPAGGLTSLTGVTGNDLNASVTLARDIGETVKRIDGSEVPILTKWLRDARPQAAGDDRGGKTGAPKAAARPAEAAVATAEVAGRRPEGLDAPRGGTADDLKMIKGVGPKLEALLHSLGFFHFDQVAGWGEAELAWVDANLEGFKGRASRDEWVAQARVLAAGGETEFSRRAEEDGRYDEE
ncbi:NADH-quinone oxidoreductase subunit NuoE [Paracoccus marinaquae]|uniref:NADH-quinone oxidoreductase subunit NuoE n=1 Tax=Paracoccus marinaquae TaxID=2841926 RepID=A0ABS6AI51_9RHOB|nr:NADH-quinone oxidoreductase subunit NuoE [Paracoccus marinaquae]MBU3030263.1 NADH-quinone oxidoreductase subunit NuoE [Paracoccus marinaquae]